MGMISKSQKKRGGGRLFESENGLDVHLASINGEESALMANGHYRNEPERH